MYLDPAVDTDALFAFGTTIDYFCDAGMFFEDDDTKLRETLTCNEGYWNGTLGQCVKSKIEGFLAFFCKLDTTCSIF